MRGSNCRPIRGPALAGKLRSGDRGEWGPSRTPPALINWEREWLPTRHSHGRRRLGTSLRQCPRNKCCSGACPRSSCWRWSSARRKRAAAARGAGPSRRCLFYLPTNPRLNNIPTGVSRLTLASFDSILMTHLAQLSYSLRHAFRSWVRLMP